MANISNVINVTLLAETASVLEDNPNVCCVITKQQTGPINTANRYALYSDPASVAADFGSDAAITAHANAFFGTSPNPVSAGGLFVAGYWRGDEEVTAATAAVLTGGELDEESVLAALQAIDDGSFDIDVDGSTENAASLDFRVCATMSDVLVILNAAVTSATWTYVNNRIIVTSDTTGALSLIDYAAEGASGTFVGELLKLSSGSGASTVQGAASATLSAETKVAGITAIKALVNFKGSMFIDAPSDADKALLAAWAQANGTLHYDVFTGAVALTNVVANPAWAIKLASQSNYRCLYSAANNRLLATSYMARMHTVNFNAEKSALTMHLKTLSVPAESYTQTQITGAKAVGLDLYTTFKGVPKVLSSGANDFPDNRYNLLAFIDAVQVGLFNLLATTSTKIPQTTQGVNQLVDDVEKTCARFVRAGVFAPGTWSSPDFFGDLEVFNRNIEENGFYVRAGLLADQAQSDRAARKSPVIQVAVKNAGAIHSADVIINFNL